MPSQWSYRDELLRVIDEVVAPGAAEVDASGTFPSKQVDALGAGGLLALTVAAEFGGAGAGPGGGAMRVGSAWCGARSFLCVPPTGGVGNLHLRRRRRADGRRGQGDADRDR